MNLISQRNAGVCSQQCPILQLQPLDHVLKIWGKTEIKYLDRKGSKLFEILAQITMKKGVQKNFKIVLCKIFTYTTETKVSFEHSYWLQILLEHLWEV